MQKPALHINGTPREHLLESYTDAVNALTDAIAALSRSCPHMRDYMAPGTYHTDAVAEHRHRMQQLQGVLAELRELQEHVA
jgi:predicted phage tail protein